PGGNQAGSWIQSGSANVDQAVLQLTGQDAAGTLAPYIQTFRSNTSADMIFAHSGTIEYSNPGSLVVESWHPVSYQAGWSNAAAPSEGVSYKRDVFGRVVFKGIAQFTGTDSAPSWIFIL